MICKDINDIKGMRAAGNIVAGALNYAKSLIKPNISTFELDKLIEKYIIDKGAKPSFLHYDGFPASICASVNSTVVHGIPSKNTVLKEGDIISIDVGACYKGFHGDAARTFPVGKIDAKKKKLIKVTKESFVEGIKNIKPGSFVGDIGHQIH